MAKSGRGVVAGRVRWKAEPDAHLALDADRPAVGLDDAARDRQAQPGARLRAGVVGVDLVEALEDRRELLLRDPAPGVGDREAHPLLGAREPAGRVTATVTVPPAGVNFTALPTRLTTAWVTRSPSQIAQASVWATKNSTPASRARGSSGATASQTREKSGCGLRADREGAALQPLEVDDVVDQPGEPLASAGGHLEDRAGALGQRSGIAVGQQLQRAADGGQGGAQLVADGRDELALHGVEPLVLGGELAQLLGPGDHPVLEVVAQALVVPGQPEPAQGGEREDARDQHRLRVVRDAADQAGADRHGGRDVGQHRGHEPAQVVEQGAPVGVERDGAERREAQGEAGAHVAELRVGTRLLPARTVQREAEVARAEGDEGDTQQHDVQPGLARAAQQHDHDQGDDQQVGGRVDQQHEGSGAVDRAGDLAERQDRPEQHERGPQHQPVEDERSPGPGQAGAHRVEREAQHARHQGGEVERVGQGERALGAGTAVGQPCGRAERVEQDGGCEQRPRTSQGPAAVYGGVPRRGEGDDSGEHRQGVAGERSPGESTELDGHRDGGERCHEHAQRHGGAREPGPRETLRDVHSQTMSPATPAQAKITTN